jgi:hypothetical protein
MGRCYHHNEMKAERIGRVLGIGLRVAGRVAGQQLSGAAQPGAPAAASAPPRPAPVAVRAEKAGQTTRNVARGLGGFVKPFTRVGGILWLELTGAFYLLFALAFAGVLWKQHALWAQGKDHAKLLAEAAVMLLFLYLGVSAFWRASRR